MTRKVEYIVPLDCHGMTVKDFARNRLGFSSRVLIEQKQREDGILRNGLHCRVVDVLSAGDTLTFCLPEEETFYPPFPAELTVLFENDDYLAVDKPANMPVHPSPGHDLDSLLNAVAYRNRQTGQNMTFRPLYRLDKDTSGIVVMGKHRAAVSSAAIEKRYFAVCEGSFTGSGTIDLPIGLQSGSKILRKCGHGESAVTHWRALAAEGGHTLLAFRLETGRTHQIRAHMSHLGYPVAGDDLYGGSRETIGRQALHCGFAKLTSPALGIEKALSAGFPEDMRRAFPWLPDLETILKEEFSCPPV